MAPLRYAQLISTDQRSVNEWQRLFKQLLM